MTSFANTTKCDILRQKAKANSIQTVIRSTRTIRCSTGWCRSLPAAFAAGGPVTHPAQPPGGVRVGRRIEDSFRKRSRGIARRAQSILFNHLLLKHLGQQFGSANSSSLRKCVGAPEQA